MPSSIAVQSSLPSSHAARRALRGLENTTPSLFSPSKLKVRTNQLKACPAAHHAVRARYSDFAICSCGGILQICQWYRVCDAGALRAEPLATLSLFTSCAVIKASCVGALSKPCQKAKKDRAYSIIEELDVNDEQKRATADSCSPIYGPSPQASGSGLCVQSSRDESSPSSSAVILSASNGPNDCLAISHLASRGRVTPSLVPRVGA